MSEPADREGVVPTTTLDCPFSCEVPVGVELHMVPPPRHDWSDVIHCPNEDCGRHFLVVSHD